MTQIHLVVMGVAGCGKSTVARRLSEQLGWPFAEGDDFHPDANVTKMASGTPLTDDDRWPWLDAIAEWTAFESTEGHSTVVTCSALRRVYRDRLSAAPGRTVFVHLVGPESVLAERIAERAGHFMPPSLLPSQLATLEPLEADEDGILVNVTQPVDAMVADAIERLGLGASTPVVPDRPHR